MIQKATACYIYQPGKYKEIFDSLLGQNIWNYLNSENGITILNEASENGLPAEDAVNDVLFAKFGDNIVDYELQEAISHMVGFIMQSHGYMLVKRSQHPYKSLLFIWSTRYKKTNRSKSGLEIIEIGGSRIYEDWLTKKDTNNAKFDAFTKKGKTVVEIIGKAVFEDFDNIPNELQVADDISFDSDSCFTVLSRLTVPEIYMRVKNFYDEMLNSDGSKIANIPNEPTNNQLLDMIEQIIGRGFLYHARMEKDKYGVRLEQYANALKKKL